MKIHSPRLCSLAFVGTAAVMLFSHAAQAATSTWKVPGATSTDWNTPGNWLGGAVPANGDDVVVNADGTFDPTGYNGAELNSLTLTGSQNLSISGVKVGAGGVSNNTPGASFFLTGTTTLLANSIWGGTRTIFTDKVTGNFKITANGNAARFESNSPDWTGGLDVRADAAMANNFAAGTITPWGTGTITMINQKLDGVSNVNARLNFASNANNITPATAYVLENDIVLTDPGTLNFVIQQATNMAAAGDPHYYVLSGDITGAVNSSRTLTFANIYASAATTPATFTLTGANTYAAQTVINANTTLQIGDGGTNGTLGSNTGSITNSGTLAINRSDAVSVANVITGAGRLEQRGAGTTTLSGNNAYTGSTTVIAGSLIINGNQSAATGVLSVSSGATLGGSGTIGGATTISGTLLPGNSIGTLTFANNLTLGGSSTSDFEINGFTTGLFDLVSGGTGSQTVTFGGTLNLMFLNGFSTEGSVKIFDFENYSGGFSILNTTGLADGYSATFDSLSGTVNVVPEPSTYALLALAAAGLGAHVVRRRRSSR